MCKTKPPHCQGLFYVLLIKITRKPLTARNTCPHTTFGEKLINKYLTTRQNLQVDKSHIDSETDEKVAKRRHPLHLTA